MKDDTHGSKRINRREILAGASLLGTTLAVAGREFDHALAVRLSGHDDATTLALLEEALRARVLEEVGSAGRYRFRHALMQETLRDPAVVPRLTSQLLEPVTESIAESKKFIAAEIVRARDLLKLVNFQPE